MTLVVPRDEAGDVAWLSRTRERLTRLDHPTVVFLEEGGRGMEALRAW